MAAALQMQAAANDVQVAYNTMERRRTTSSFVDAYIQVAEKTSVINSGNYMPENNDDSGAKVLAHRMMMGASDENYLRVGIGLLWTGNVTWLPDDDLLPDELYDLSNIELVKKKIQKKLDPNFNMNNPLPQGEEEQRPAKVRRVGVWKEQLRNEAIETDKVWAFVELMSGFMGEESSAITVVDDSEKQALAKMMKEQRAEIAKRVSEFHSKTMGAFVDVLMKKSQLQMTAGDPAVVGTLMVEKAQTDAQSKAVLSMVEAIVKQSNLQIKLPGVERGQPQPGGAAPDAGQFSEVEAEAIGVGVGTNELKARLIAIMVDTLFKHSKLQFAAPTPEDAEAAADAAAANEAPANAASIVIDGEIHKQIQDLAAGESGRPFFEANVALRQMRDAGQNGRVSVDTFERALNGLAGGADKGVQLQSFAKTIAEQVADAGANSKGPLDSYADCLAALTRQMNSTLNDQLTEVLHNRGVSIDYLSMARNSYHVKLRPDAMAAIRTAHERMTSELRMRVPLYVLIEGKDDSLTTKFAQFAAQLLMHMRLTSGISAAYVSIATSTINMTQLRISLGRLTKHIATVGHSFPNFGAWANAQNLDAKLSAAFEERRRYFSTEVNRSGGGSGVFVPVYGQDWRHHPVSAGLRRGGGWHRWY